MKTITYLCGAALLALAGPATAQGPEPRPARDADITRAQVIERVDQRFARMDVDNDGRFNSEDAAAARAQRRAQAADRMFERLDADRNGSVSRAEFDAARASRGEQRRGPGMRGQRGHRAMAMGRGPGRAMGRGMGRGMRGMRMFGEQGYLTRDQLRERALARFDRADADRNGVLTAAERQQARGARGHRRGPGARGPRNDG